MSLIYTLFTYRIVPSIGWYREWLARWLTGGRSTGLRVELGWTEVRWTLRELGAFVSSVFTLSEIRDVQGLKLFKIELKSRNDIRRQRYSKPTDNIKWLRSEKITRKQMGFKKNNWGQVWGHIQDKKSKTSQGKKYWLDFPKWIFFRGHRSGLYI